MSDKPILFSGPMVRALMAGTKTQTRRTMTIVPPFAERVVRTPKGPGWLAIGAGRSGGTAGVRYEVGDRLYVREIIERAGFQGQAVGYPADGTWLPNTPWQWERKALPSIHMPRRLSRITLTVTDVRVERLQDISETDCLAEGPELAASDRVLGGPLVYTATPQVYVTPRAWYRELWGTINGPGAWDANPWVAAYTFTVALGNIDQLARAA